MQNTIDDSKTIDFKETVRKHRQYIFSLAYRLTGQREEAEDLAQETFHFYRFFTRHLFCQADLSRETFATCFS